MPQASFDLDQAYATLGLAPGAGLEQVKAAYRRLARDLHPDLNPQAPAGEMARVNAAHGLLLRHLKPGPEVSPYRFANWAPRTGQREYRFDEFNPGPSQPFGPRPSAPRRPSVAENQASAGSQSGPDRQTTAEPPLGPLAAHGPTPAGTAWGPEPTQRPAASGRLTGLERQGPAMVYRVEVSGRPAVVTLPLRQARTCGQCQGGGRRPDGRGPCPACAGRGEIVASRLLRVELPRDWRPGDRLSLAGESPEQSIELELSRPGQREG